MRCRKNKKYAEMVVTQACEMVTIQTYIHGYDTGHMVTIQAIWLRYRPYGYDTGKIKDALRWMVVMQEK